MRGLYRFSGNSHRGRDWQVGRRRLHLVALPPRSSSAKRSRNLSPDPTLSELRADFKRAGGRFLSMPIAGAAAWFLAAVFGAILPADQAAIALVIALLLISPSALVIARFLNEQLVGGGNDLGRLMGRSMLMVNLFWAVAVPFWIADPSSLPLTAGVIMGLQWIVLGWIIQHWIGLVHAIVRTASVVAVWSLFPQHRFVAVPLMIVVVYLVSIFALVRRRPYSRPAEQ